jgi:hypothetical protein
MRYVRYVKQIGNCAAVHSQDALIARSDDSRICKIASAQLKIEWTLDKNTSLMATAN